MLINVICEILNSFMAFYIVCNALVYILFQINYGNNNYDWTSSALCQTTETISNMKILDLQLRRL
jgi:hypothetical protein